VIETPELGRRKGGRGGQRGRQHVDPAISSTPMAWAGGDRSGD
jgi:hypothetical protein